jgi:Tol biopolymer transport system component
VIYQNGLGVGKPTLWRTPLNGGAPEQLVDTFATKPALSQDGKRIAYIYMDADRWRIGIVPADGGKILQRLDLPPTVIEHLIRWSPDGEALYYISTIGDVGNVWSLPLAGTPPKQLTSFTSQLLGDFVLSPDGQRFAFTRGSESRDVVLLDNSR